MDEYEALEEREECEFIVNEVSRIIKQSIEETLGSKAYNHDLAKTWAGQAIETCLNVLTKDQKPYKYVATCMIMQKNGAGLHTASSCFWNKVTDGSCTVRWENKHMYCILSIFGLAV